MDIQVPYILLPQSFYSFLSIPTPGHAASIISFLDQSNSSLTCISKSILHLIPQAPIPTSIQLPESSVINEHLIIFSFLSCLKLPKLPDMLRIKSKLRPPAKS